MNKPTKNNWLTHTPKDEREELILLRAREKALNFILSGLAIAGISIYTLGIFGVGTFTDSNPFILFLLILFLGVLVTGNNAIEKNEIIYDEIDVSSWKNIFIFWTVVQTLIATGFVFFDHSDEYSTIANTIIQTTFLISSAAWIWYVHKNAPVSYRLILSFPLISMMAVVYHAVKGKKSMQKFAIITSFIVILALPIIGFILGSIL